MNYKEPIFSSLTSKITACSNSNPNPGDGPPVECCYCIYMFGSMGTVNNQNEIPTCPTESGYIDVGYQYQNEDNTWSYNVQCRKDVFVSCSYWLQTCPDDGVVNDALCAYTGNCVNGECQFA